VDHIKENSQIKVIVECPHGQREVRWNRRHQLCYKCAAEKGLYNTSKSGRDISWGDKISRAKKGKALSKEHKEAIINSRKSKLAKRLNIPIEQTQFPTKSYQYKIRTFIMSALKRSLLNNSIENQDRIIKDKLGYSVADLCRAIELKFQNGMTWDNYGDWEIDHVKPDSWFQYSSTDEQGFKNSFAIDNLQPMWKHENRKKNNLYEGYFKEKILYALCGQSGVGKTTVSNKVQHLFTVIDSDDFSKIKDMDRAIRNNWFNDRPILLQIGVHISTTLTRYSQQGYKIVPLFIIEDENTVIERIISRGGKRIHNVRNRYKRVTSLASKVAHHVCNADDMVQYLLDYGEKIFRSGHDSGVAT